VGTSVIPDITSPHTGLYLRVVKTTEELRHLEFVFEKKRIGITSSCASRVKEVNNT